MKRSDFSTGIGKLSLPPSLLPLDTDPQRSPRVRTHNVPPPSSSIPSCHDWIPGVVLLSTLTQTGRPYEASLSFEAAVRTPASIPHALTGKTLPFLEYLSCSCLRLGVASSRPPRGLSPPIMRPCLARAVGLRPPSVAPAWFHGAGRVS